MLSSQTTCDVERSFEPDDTEVVGEPLTAYLEEARGAFSRNTERALRADVQVFTAWCRQHFREAFPASAATVVAFVDDMGRVKTPATVRRYVSSIATLHKALRQANPLDSASVRFALQRMHRLRGRRQAQVQGLTWPLRNRLLEAAGDRLIDVRNRALLAVGYDTLLRRSELVSLEVPDLLEEIDGTATVLVRSGKTDADGRGAMLYLARDTVQLVKTWLELGGVDGGRLFRSVRKDAAVGERLDASQAGSGHDRLRHRVAGHPAVRALADDAHGPTLRGAVAGAAQRRRPAGRAAEALRRPRRRAVRAVSPAPAGGSGVDVRPPPEAPLQRRGVTLSRAKTIDVPPRFAAAGDPPSRCHAGQYGVSRRQDKLFQWLTNGRGNLRTTA